VEADKVSGTDFGYIDARKSFLVPDTFFFHPFLLSSHLFLPIWTELYAKVGRGRGMWIGADMVAPPKGFEILVIVGVTRAAEPPA